MGLTDNEIQYFNNTPIARKVDVLYYYLVEGQGNMEKIASILGIDDSRQVSQITRGYQFEGRNQGIFSKKSRFFTEYGYEVTRKDIEDFVLTYPRYEDYGDLEAFLIDRIQFGSYSQGSSNLDNQHQINHFQESRNDYSWVLYLIGGLILLILGYQLILFIWGIVKPLVDFFIQYWLMIVMLVGIIAWVIRTDKR